MGSQTLLISAAVESGVNQHRVTLTTAGKSHSLAVLPRSARRLSYTVSVRAKASEAAIRDLITHTDKAAEVHNTLRLGIPVILESCKAEAIPGNDAA